MTSTIPPTALTSPPDGLQDAPDHRSRVALGKRVATRARIVSAILDLVSDPSNLTVSIEDVVKAAGIARGTFYKHFASMDEALLATGREVRDQFTAAILPGHDLLTHPLQRFSCGMHCFLTHAHADRRWAGFALREERVPGRSLHWPATALRPWPRGCCCAQVPARVFRAQPGQGRTRLDRVCVSDLVLPRLSRIGPCNRASCRRPASVQPAGAAT